MTTAEQVPFSKIRKGSSFIHEGEHYKKVSDKQGEDWYDKKVSFKPDTLVSKPPKKMSKIDRWNAACADAREALDKARDLEERINADKGELEAKLTDAKSEIVSALEQLKEMADEFGEPYDNMPDGLQQSPYGQKCEAMQQLDLEASDEDELEELEAKVDEAEGAEVPLGFGRD
jgi:DNA repair exonuclease SbcCD ATPase subunit